MRGMQYGIMPLATPLWQISYKFSLVQALKLSCNDEEVNYITY